MSLLDIAENRSIHTGFLYRRGDQLVQIPFTVHILKPLALAVVHHIHHEALRSVRKPGLVRVDTDAFFADHFTGDGRTLGVYADHQWIAYGILGMPSGADYPYDRFAEDLKLPDTERTHIGQLIGVGVLPEWRGNHLHHQLCEWRLELARATGCWHAAGVSAPDNPFSWRNLMAVGLRIKQIKMLGGDKLRYLFHTDLRYQQPLDPETATSVDVCAIAEQQALLNQGYQGYAPVQGSPQPMRIWYARPSHS